MQKTLPQKATKQNDNKKTSPGEKGKGKFFFRFLTQFQILERKCLNKGKLRWESRLVPVTPGLGTQRKGECCKFEANPVNKVTLSLVKDRGPV